MKKIPYKNLTDISQEWDAIVNKRQNAIENGTDVSLLYVTMPCILRHLKKLHPQKVLDVGCGSGFLTHKVSQICTECWGIDQSRVSIDLAQKKYGSSKLHFSISEICKFHFPKDVDVCIANMVFMDDPEWEQSLAHIFDQLPLNGSLLFTITHPCFWPKYWKYDDSSWFNYSEETYIESDFSITAQKHFGNSTHIHRPLSQYINNIISTGFTIMGIEEPLPICKLPDDYEQRYPRFLFFNCKKT